MIQNQLESFHNIRSSLLSIRNKEIKNNDNVQEMNSEQIKGGMENYMKQISEKSKLNLEKDFSKQLETTKQESDKFRIEDEIMQSVMKESLNSAPQVSR
jgi:hypothetical protein